MKSFTETLDQQGNSNSQEIISLKKNIYTKSYSKGTLLQHPGSANKFAFYVKKGLLRSYTVDEKGKEHVFMFAPEEWLIADGAIDGANELFIDTLEETEVEYINQESFSSQFLHLTAVNDSKRAEGMIKRMAVMQKRIIMLISATALERYEHFIETYPDIIQRVPQKMIASYLGITPEALSKVKGMRLRR